MATVLQGKIEAKRKPGRPSITFMENIKKASKMNIQQVAHKCLDRKNWREIVSASGVAANIVTDDADR